MSKSACEIADRIMGSDVMNHRKEHVGHCHCNDDIVKALETFRDEAVNEAYEKAAVKAETCIVRGECTAHGHDSRWCAVCEHKADAAEFIAMKIRALKTAPAKELLFSGQCNHHVPMGQPCSACGR